jgi:catalase
MKKISIFLFFLISCVLCYYEEYDPKNTMTTSSGSPVDDNRFSMTAGKLGPILLEDFHLRDKLTHLLRERIPERVVHAKGAGAYGYFEVTNEKIRK